MTENEVIEVLKNEKECVLRNIKGCDRGCGKCDLVMDDSVIVNAYDRVIMALQEIQQYRAIGTVEECREAREYLNKMNYNGEWILCKDRLPKDDANVLVWYEYFRYGEYNRLFQTIGISYTHNGEWSGFVNGSSGWNQLNILAWQPLPEPYHK